MVEVTLDLTETEIATLDLERTAGGGKLQFSVEGEVRGLPDEKLEQLLKSQAIEPVSLTVETGYEDESDSE